MKKLSIGLWSLAAVVAVFGCWFMATEQEATRQAFSFEKSRQFQLQRLKALDVGFFANPQDKQPKKQYHTGRKVDPVKLAKARELSFQRHLRRLKALPKVTAATFDCIAMGWVPPVVDQGQCGSCWDFSGSGVVTSALIKAGFAKNDGSFRISEQYTLDCYSNGGCDGDDNITVLAHAKASGLPTQADYGPYTASGGRCKGGSYKLWTIADWGFCSTQDNMGVASVQDIKNAMVQYGPIGAAIAADDAFMNAPPGKVFDVTTSTGIDHDIILVGWDDSKGKKGAWKLRNSWGPDWCDNGYIWIGYGVNLVGTEACWAVATPLTPLPPTPPGPNPPGPVAGGTPPFKLYEGTAPLFTQVGTVTGYGDLASAQADAKTIATNDKTPVLVYDSSKPPALVETVQPGFKQVSITLTDAQIAAVLQMAKAGKGEPPLGLKLPNGISWWRIVADLEKLATDISDAAPNIQADIRQLLIDLGMQPAQAKKLQLGK